MKANVTGTLIMLLAVVMSAFGVAADELSRLPYSLAEWREKLELPPHLEHCVIKTAG